MPPFIDAYDTFLFDLDGVIYVGDKTLPGAPDLLARLRAAGRHVRFLTNDPLPTREDVIARLATHGIAAALDEIVTSGWATAAWLRERRLDAAWVIGSPGLRSEIARAGVRVVADDEPAPAVVVGCDEDTAYRHIRAAVQRIHRGAQFIATNDDATFPTPEGPAPATGAIVAAVRVATGLEPHVVGKPHAPMFEAALAGCPHERVVMIGDNPATDILGARRLGLSSILVGSGTRQASGTPLTQADRTIATLADLIA